MSEFVPRLLGNFERHQLRPHNGRLLVAVSGGIDSMVLLTGLLNLAPKLELSLRIAHADHQLRGAESDRDAASVAAVAAHFGLPVVIRKLEVRSKKSASPESVEMVARRLRHRFLAEEALAGGESTVALGHQADDQAELVLLRLLRGAGSDGLSGMNWCDPSPADSQVRLIRPLLDFSRDELRQAAAELEVTFREDSSNQGPQYLRNRIRHELLPYLEREFNPRIRRGLQRTADILGAEAAWLADEVRKWRASTNALPFAELPVALQRGILRQQLWEWGQEGDFETIEKLRESVPSTQSPLLTLTRGSDGILRSKSPLPNYRIEERSVVLGRTNRVHLGGAELVLKRSRKVAAANALFAQESFDAQRVGSVVTFRHWRPGDRFQPLGFRQPSKVQNLFVNRKIPPAERRTAVVGTTAAGILFWVEGLPPGETFKLGPKTDQILTVKWRRER